MNSITVAWGESEHHHTWCAPSTSQSINVFWIFVWFQKKQVKNGWCWRGIFTKTKAPSLLFCSILFFWLHYLRIHDVSIWFVHLYWNFIKQLLSFFFFACLAIHTVHRSFQPQQSIKGHHTVVIVHCIFSSCSLHLSKSLCLWLTSSFS